MESLRGIFPTSQPPPKRDFLRENVARIKNIQRLSKPRNKSEYSKFAVKSRDKSSGRYCESVNPSSRPSNSNLAICSSKAITNLRKSLSTMSLASREFGTQTVDPESDEYFLKDTIIRYPSASTVRSVNQNQAQTCSRGHQISEPEKRPKTNRDQYSEKMDHHLSNLSEYIERGAISKQRKPTSILKSSSSLQKLNKNSINESQQREDRSHRVASASQRSARIETVQISDDDNETQEDEIDENKKEFEASQEKKKELGGGDSDSTKRQQQLKAAADDPDCPDGHVPMLEDERLEALKIAQKRKIFHVTSHHPLRHSKMYQVT